MAIEQNSGVLRHIGAIFSEGVAAELTDDELLRRFTSRPRQDDSAELAFAALVDRHGPMVLRVCRAALRDEHDAQDAFQAVFLVLVHKMRSLRVHDSLGPWLHAVALRVSAHARALAARRRTHEYKSAELATRSESEPGDFPDELEAAIHEEVGHLPEAFRKAVVLCDLEGLTHEEAACRLGWPVGTVKSRQARGRDRLRGRLIRRGLGPVAGGMAATVLAPSPARAAVRQPLLKSTVKMALLVARGSGTTAGGTISALTMTSTQGVLRAMWLTRMQIAAGALLCLGAVGTVAGLAVHAGRAAGPPQAPAAGRANQPKVKTEAPPSSLDQLRPEDIPADKRQGNPSTNVVAILGEVRGRHAGEVRGLALSRDGKLLATVADQDNKVRLWDAQTLQPRGALAGHRAYVNCLALSPDGHWLATGGAYGDFFLWDMSLTPAKGPALLPTRGTIEKFNNLMHATAFSPDGKLLAVAGDAGSAEIFDASGAEMVSRGVLAGFNQRVHSLTFSPGGTILALAGLEDGSVRFWDLTVAPPREKAVLEASQAAAAAMPLAPRAGVPGQAVRDLLPIAGRRRGVISVAFSPDGKTLAALEEDGDVSLCDLVWTDPGNQVRLKVRLNHKDPPMKRPGIAMFGLRDLAMVSFSPDGKTLAAAQPSGWIRLWDLKDGQPIDRASFPAHEGPVTGVLRFSPDGTTLFSGGADHLVRTWDLTAAEPRESNKPEGPIGGLGAVAFSPDGKKLAVSDAEFVRLWDLSDTGNLSRLPAPRTKIDAGPAGSLAFSPTGKILICGGEFNTLPSMWDVSEHAVARLRDLHAPGFLGIRSMAFSADGDTLAAGYNDHKIRVWDMRGPEPKEWLVLDGDDQWPPAAAISPHGVYLAFSGPEHSIRLWTLAGLKPRERAVIKGTGWPVSSVAFSPNGKILAAGTNGGTRLWDISGKTLRALHSTWQLLGFSSARPITECLGFSLVFSLDGNWLIAADHIADKAGKLPSRPAVCVYDVAAGKRLYEWDLSAPSWAIALAPDGRHVAVAQQNGVALILRLPDNHGR